MMRGPGFTLCAIVLLAVAGAGCDDSAAQPSADVRADGESVPAVLDRPEGMAVVADTLYVTNVAGGYDASAGRVVYRAGFVRPFALPGLEPGEPLAMPCENPQYVIGHGEDELLVVCSGRLEPDADGAMLPQSDGALVRIDRGGWAVTKMVPIPVGEPAADAGFPGNPVLLGETLWLGAGAGPYLTRIDLASDAVETFALPHPGVANELTVPVVWEGRLFATSFVRGVLFEVDPASGEVLGEPLDITETDEVEGAIDATVWGDSIYVLHSLSSTVTRIRPATGEVSTVCHAGAAANRLAIRDDTLLVVNSMDNNLTRHDLATGKTITPFASFPPGTNPWAVVIHGSTAYVDGYLDNGIYEVGL